MNGILKRKTESVQHDYNTQYLYLLKKYIKCDIWWVAVLPSYIQDAWFLKINQCGYVN
jgi:hypothetical protein